MPEDEMANKRKSRKKKDVAGADATKLSSLCLHHLAGNTPIPEVPDVMPGTELITDAEWAAAEGKHQGVFELSREEVRHMASKETAAMGSGYPLAWDGECLLTPRDKKDLRLAAPNGKKCAIQDVFFLAWKSERELAMRGLASKVTGSCGNTTTCVGRDHLIIHEFKRSRKGKRKAEGSEKSAVKKKSKLDEGEDVVGQPPKNLLGWCMTDDEFENM